MKRHDATFIAIVLCILSLFGCVAFVHAQDKIPLAPSSTKDALWTAVHKRDLAEKQISDLNARFLQLQQQATQQLQTLQAQDKQAADAIEAAKKQAYALAKLDPGKYDLDLETMEFSQKAPAPEPKK